MDHVAEGGVCVGGGGEVYSDLDIGSQNASAGVDHDAEVCVCAGVWVCV